jgi:hypothetical protein
VLAYWLHYFLLESEGQASAQYAEPAIENRGEQRATGST